MVAANGTLLQSTKLSEARAWVAGCNAGDGTAVFAGGGLSGVSDDCYVPCELWTVWGLLPDRARPPEQLCSTTLSTRV
jgi:hypothetical protein